MTLPDWTPEQKRNGWRCMDSADAICPSCLSKIGSGRCPRCELPLDDHKELVACPKQ